MNINELSTQFYVRLLTKDDVNLVYSIMTDNPLYFKYCPPEPSIKSVEDDMTALPPNKTYDDKYYIGFFKEGELVCVMDLIDKYPANKSAFIGFFMIKKEFQKNNVGTNIIKELLEYFQKEQYKEIKLGYVQGNPQAKAFWEKNGFIPTGVISHQELYDVIVMYKPLNV